MILSPASNGAGQSFLHLVNSPFHEAGHLLFRPFGDFVTSLGGTLGQLLMPLICAGTLLLKTRDPFGAAVACWWFGQNFVDIAPYINDARAGDLPLLGGNFGHSSPYGFHDWEYLLTESGLLHLDHHIAWLSHGLGAVIMLLALAWGAPSSCFANAAPDATGAPQKSRCTAWVREESSRSRGFLWAV